MVDQRRLAWSRTISERGRVRYPLATSCSIGKPLAHCALYGEISARLVVNAHGDPIGVTEIELAQIAMQVGFADMEVAAVDTALQDRKIR